MLLGDDADDVIFPPRGLNRNLQQANANTIPNNANNAKAFHAGGTGGPPEHDGINKIEKDDNTNLIMNEKSDGSRSS